MAKKPTQTKPTKKKAPEVSLEQLIAVAENFNEFMFDNPEAGINLELDYVELYSEVKDSAGELVAEDIISATTAATLDALGIEYEAKVDEAEEADEPDADDEEPAEDDDDQDDDTDEEDEPEPVDPAVIKVATTQLAAVKKGKKIEDLKIVAKEAGLNIPPPFLKDIKKMREYLAKKLQAVIDGTAAPKATKKEKAPKKEKKQGVMDALRTITCKDENITQEELTKQIEAAGFVVTQRTIFSVLNDTQKIIAELKLNGRLKK